MLEISSDANEREIKRAYRRLALKWHPDKNPDNVEEANKKFQEIGEAYEVLSNKKTRRQYDNPGFHFNFGGFGDNHDPFDIFEQFFDGSFDDLFNRNFDNKRKKYKKKTKKKKKNNGFFGNIYNSLFGSDNEFDESYNNFDENNFNANEEDDILNSFFGGGGSSSSFSFSSSSFGSSSFSSMSTSTSFVNGQKITTKTMSKNGKSIEEKYINDELVERIIDGQKQNIDQIGHEEM